MVKVIITGRAAPQGPVAEHLAALTRTERALAPGDDRPVRASGAASALWAATGRTWLRRFLNRAGMADCGPGPGRGVGAHPDLPAADETRRLPALPLEANRARSDTSFPRTTRSTDLMADVIGSQRWGSAATGRRGAWSCIAKNGWLPLSGPVRLADQRRHRRLHRQFVTRRSRYSNVVLTQS